VPIELNCTDIASALHPYCYSPKPNPVTVVDSPRIMHWSSRNDTSSTRCRCVPIELNCTLLPKHYSRAAAMDTSDAIAPLWPGQPCKTASPQRLPPRHLLLAGAPCVEVLFPQTQALGRHFQHLILAHVPAEVVWGQTRTQSHAPGSANEQGHAIVLRYAGGR